MVKAPFRGKIQVQVLYRLLEVVFLEQVEILESKLIGYDVIGANNKAWLVVSETLLDLWVQIETLTYGDMMKLADMTDLKFVAHMSVWVQIPLSLLSFSL